MHRWGKRFITVDKDGMGWENGICLQCGKWIAIYPSGYWSARQPAVNEVCAG